MLTRLFIIAVCLLSGWGCKPFEFREAALSTSDDAHATAIRRVDLNGEIDWGTVELTRSGKVKGRLVLSLDRQGIRHNEGVTLPSCFVPLSPNTQIGRMQCTKGQEMEIPLFARHIVQECYTNNQIPIVPPSDDIIMSGCLRAQLRGFHFEPKIRMDIEL